MLADDGEDGGAQAIGSLFADAGDFEEVLLGRRAAGAEGFDGRIMQDHVSGHSLFLRGGGAPFLERLAELGGTAGCIRRLGC